MNDSARTTRAIRSTEGSVLVEQPDGSYRPVETRTDWQRIDRMNDAAIDAQTAGDDDAPDRVDKVWAVARPIYPIAKERVTMRLDADMVDWFRQQGKGYQTKINAILRGYFEHRRNERQP